MTKGLNIEYRQLLLLAILRYGVVRLRFQNFMGLVFWRSLLSGDVGKCLDGELEGRRVSPVKFFQQNQCTKRTAVKLLMLARPLLRGIPDRSKTTFSGRVREIRYDYRNDE
jgi:hypothetical protein